MSSNGVIFPACLRETDKSGKLRTRNTKTEAAYRKRYGGMATTLAKKSGEPHVEIDQVIDDLRARAPWLKKRSYYLYRAVILQALRDLYHAGGISDAEVERLVQRMKPASETPVASKRNGKSRRCRHFQPATQGALVSILRRRSSETARNLADMLDFGPEIGVRVCEFFGCRLDKRILWVSSAKYSEANERGIAEFRPIELLQFNDQELRELADLIARLNCELEAVNGDSVGGLGLTAACRLAAPSTPKHVIATVLERVKQGERVTLNEIDDLLQAEKNRCAGALTIRAGDVEASKICALVDGIGAALASPLIEELTEFIEIATPAALQLFKTELRARKHPIADPTTCPQLPS